MGNRRPYLDAVTFHFEGAYRAHDPVEAAVFGYNITNFMRDAPQIWPHVDKHGMHPEVVALMQTVVAGGNGARHAAEQLFDGIGERTQSIGKGRTGDIPINNAPETTGYIDSVKRIIRPLTEHNYNRQFGLGAIHDEYIRHEAMDSMYIRPHSGVWSIVYAAKHAGILSDSKATELGYKYITPKDANDPAIMSGDARYTLPPEREGDRGKGRMYIPTKAPQQRALHELAELINHATPQQMRAMHYYMHEARTKFFSATVAVEGERAAHGDTEGATLFAAHSKSNPTAGWLRRADASFHYYHAPGMELALQQAAAASVAAPHTKATPPEQSTIWDTLADMGNSLVCNTTGFMCPAEAKPPRRR